jgi:hypothetical protein
MISNSEGHERWRNGSSNDSDSRANRNQESIRFEALYPAIQGDWGLPNDIPDTPPQWMGANSLAEIESQLREVGHVHKLPIGSQLAKYIAKWAVCRKPKGMTSGTADWDVAFFNSALLGRVPQFVQWAIDHPSPYSDLAVKSVRMVYDYRWPHNASAGYIFYAIWGRMQLELRKPGESKPATIAEQKAFLQKRAEENGERVVGWSSLGAGGIMAITEPKDKPNTPSEDRNSNETAPTKPLAVFHEYLMKLSQEGHPSGEKFVDRATDEYYREFLKQAGVSPDEAFGLGPVSNIPMPLSAPVQLCDLPYPERIEAWLALPRPPVELQTKQEEEEGAAYKYRRPKQQNRKPEEEK